MNGVLLTALSMFARSWMLPVAVLACVMVAMIAWRMEARRRSRLAKLGDLPVLERLMPRRSAGLPPQLRGLLLGSAALCIGIALAGPRWGEREERRRNTGVDMALVLDVSSSMLAVDEGTSRLSRMKSDVQRLLATMPEARVAMLVVAGRSYILTPLTADHDALSLFLDGIDPGMVSQGGTAIAQGIEQATQLLGTGQAAGDRALIVMSDGETWDNDGAVAQAAELARNARLAVITVAYGTEAGANIPLPGGGVKRDADGQAVVTRSSPTTLAGIARSADGVFVDALSADRPGRIRTALRRLRQTERVYNAGTSPIQRYALFLWPALLLLLIDALLAERSWRRAKVAAGGIVVCALSLIPGPAAAQSIGGRSPEPTALFREHRFAEAAQAFRSQIRNGDRSLRGVYNLGTALMEADSTAPAVDLLERVVSITPDADLRFRALFNLGLANLRRARASAPNDASPYYSAAVAAYKRALRTRSDDPDAKWNLELAIRDQQQRSGGAGGGGGGAEPPPQPPPPSKAQKELDKQRADAVLNSASRDERDVQTKRQRDGTRREAPNGRDW
jgi:Ca-activated chloride channel homolog